MWDKKKSLIFCKPWEAGRAHTLSKESLSCFLSLSREGKAGTVPKAQDNQPKVKVYYIILSDFIAFKKINEKRQIV